MNMLPAGFEALEPFVASWAVDGSAARAHRRTCSTTEERQAFYDAFSPLILPALALLDGKALTAHDDAEQRLMQMSLAFAHIALAVEALGDDEAKHAPHREQMHIIRTPAGA